MMRLFSTWGIRRRLVYLILTIATLTVLAVSVIALSASAGALRRQTEAAYVNRNQTFAGALDTRLQNAVVTARALAAAISDPQHPPFDLLWPMISRILTDPRAAFTRAALYLPTEDAAHVLSFSAPAVGSRLAAPQRLNAADLSGAAWLDQSYRSGGAGWHGPMPSPLAPAADLVVVYTTPFYRAPDVIGGLVWLELPLARLDAALAETLNHEMSYSLLLTADHNVAAGLNLPGQMELSGRSNVLRAFLSQEAVVRARQPMQDGAGAFYIGPDPFDPQMMCVVLMNRLPATGWQLISVLPAHTLQSPLERSLTQLVVFALMGIGTLGWAAYTFIGRTISEPLRRLSWAAQEIGSGDLRYAIPYRQQKNEIGRLATALEDMKQNLAHSYSQLSAWSHTLEKRVNERTVELEAAQQQAQQRAAELQAVYDAALTVVGDYELNAMLGTLIENILKLLNTSYCAVWLLTADKKHLQLVAATSDKQHLNMLLEINEGLVGAAMRQGKLVIVDEYSQWPDRVEQFVDPSRERVMAAPLLFYKRAIGTVLVGRPREMPAFTPQDERLLTLFANLVSPVVRNAQLYIQREAAREEAERASSVKTRFLASVTHELRTPLNLVINNMDFMRIGAFGEVNDEQRARLDQAIRSAEHLLYLINDLLDVSKIEAGEMELVIQPGDLRRVLDDALDAAAMMIERAGRPLQLRSEIPDALPSVPMDARRVRQVLTNLLSNAVKFTEAGVITLRAQTLPSSNGAADEMGGCVELSVSDTGMGIAPDEMDKLFQAFERTDRSKYAGIEGTGLGLAISRFLVEAHGGTMTVESKVGVGSTFRFTLPLRAARPLKAAPLTVNAAIGVD